MTKSTEKKIVTAADYRYNLQDLFNCRLRILKNQSRIDLALGARAKSNAGGTVQTGFKSKEARAFYRLFNKKIKRSKRSGKTTS